jgi:chloramphenicol 3-O-phosphotransferase
MARAGAWIIVDEAFPGGAASQHRWQRALGDLQVDTTHTQALDCARVIAARVQ